jgi:hypothetical protein
VVVREVDMEEVIAPKSVGDATRICEGCKDGTPERGEVKGRETPFPGSCGEAAGGVGRGLLAGQIDLDSEGAEFQT